MRTSAVHSAIISLAFATAVGMTGCDKARPISDGGVGASAGSSACTICHGDAGRPEVDPLVQAAPPRSVDGSDGGAHLAHLHAGPYRAALACSECHQVPVTAGHSNGIVEIAFGALARTGGATPSFSGGSCASVYCHGATLNAGGAHTTPRWSGGAPETACGACHGAPPPSHDAGATDCHACHPGTEKADGTIDVFNGMHVDGKVEVNEQHPAGWADPAQHGTAAKQGIAACQACHGTDFGGGSSGVSCNACHGGTAWQTNCTFCHGTRVASFTAADLAQAAPPLGTHGETSPSQPAVGAHQTHLAGNALGAAVACTDCHATLPTSLAHVLGLPPTVEFGAGARRGGAAPAWNGITCTVYCHGSTLQAGGTNQTPSWTGGAAQAACGTCHGAPPPSPHVPRSDCGACHPGYAAAGVNLATHLNGAIEFTVTCSSCHGAPPSTGQHQRSEHRIRSCGDCHPGYTTSSVNASTHRDGTAETGNQITSYNRTTQTCTNACHGSQTW
jgi:predicted CxxxxCH...CXXCH cytochrome family protein